MIAVLDWLWSSAWFPAGLLMLISGLGRPRHLICNCHAPGFAQPHLKRPLMLVAGLLYGAAAARDVRNIVVFPEPTWKAFYAIFALALLACAAFNIRQWRKHPKDKNRHPLGRMLAVVSETAAGLRIVPIHAGGRA